MIREIAKVVTTVVAMAVLAMCVITMVIFALPPLKFVDAQWSRYWHVGDCR